MFIPDFIQTDIQYIVNVDSLFQFQFVNSFMSLFYIAFYLQDMDKLKEVSLNLQDSFWITKEVLKYLVSGEFDKGQRNLIAVRGIC